MKRMFLFILSFLFLTSLVFGDVTENFDGWSDSSYGTISTYNHTGVGQWETYNSICGSLNARSGNCARFNDDSAENEYLLFSGLDGNGKDVGIGTISFWYRHWDGDASNVEFQVQYKIGSGSWVNVGSVVDVPNDTSYREFSEVVNITDDNVFVQVISIDDAERLCIDDFSITDYTGGGNFPPAIANIVHTSGDITSSTTVSVSADVTDSDGTIGLVELHWGLTSGSLGTTITMSNGGSGDTYTTSTDIPVQSDGVTVYYEVEGTDNEPETTTSSEQNYTVFDAQTTTLPYSKTFRTELNPCYTYSDSGATKEWYWNSGEYAAMNGYDSGDTEEDWLIIPAINFDSYSDEIMTFDTWYLHGTDNSTNYLKLYYSTNYTGLGDPTGSTWNELSYTQPSAITTWTGSGNIDLSSITGSSVYIGFKYRYEDGNYRSWGIDNISVREAAGPEIAHVVSSPASPNSSQTVSVSADAVDPDGISSVELHWGLSSGSLGITISMSLDTGDNYVTDTDIPAQSDGSTVYYEIYAVDNNTNPTTSDEFSYYVSDALAPGVGDLLITEVCGDGAGGGSDDGFMEIYNTTSNTLLLANVQARYYNTNPNNPTQTVQLSGTIAPDSYIVITQNETNFNTTYAPITADFSGSMFYFNGDDDGCDIYDNSARAGVLDSFNDNGIGASPWIWNQNVFERTGSGDGAILTNWTEITSGIGTPGVDNDNPLAVNLSTFYALYIGNVPTIYWVTQTEINNDYWNVYRGTSDNFTEALHLNANAPVPGNGTTNYASEYVYVDTHPVVQNTTYWYWIEDISTDDETEVHEPITLSIPYEDIEGAPVIYGLHQNYPNPFNPSTSISFTMEEESDVELIIYNIKGEKIREYAISSDQTSIVWDGTDQNDQPVSSGVYFYKLITDTKQYQKKMLLVK